MCARRVTDLIECGRCHQHLHVGRQDRERKGMPFADQDTEGDLFSLIKSPTTVGQEEGKGGEILGLMNHFTTSMYSYQECAA